MKRYMGQVMAECDCTHPACDQRGYCMADRIEELEAELHLMKTAGIVEVAIRNPDVSEYMAHWERRAEGAEAKLAKAVDALERIGSGEFSGQVLTSMPPQDAAVFFALTALAEIKGETK